MVPGTRSDCGVPGTRSDCGVPGTRSDCGVPGTRWDSAVPGTRWESAVPGTSGVVCDIAHSCASGARDSRRSLRFSHISTGERGLGCARRSRAPLALGASGSSRFRFASVTLATVERADAIVCGSGWPRCQAPTEAAPPFATTKIQLSLQEPAPPDSARGTMRHRHTTDRS
jgi:hypothetical protein